MKLIIVESPAKAKKIQTFFNKNVIVRSSFGHINGLDTSKLDEMIEKDFKPISDMRASAKYRMMVAKNLLHKCFLEITNKQLIRINN